MLDPVLAVGVAGPTAIAFIKQILVDIVVYYCVIGCM